MSELKLLKNKAINEIEAVYFITGEEILLMQRFVEALILKIAPGTMGDFNLTKFEGKDFRIESLLESCETLPVMAEKKIVIVKNPWFLESKGGSLDKREEDKIKQYLQNPSETTCLVVYCESKPDGRKNLTKLLKKIGKNVEFKRLKENELKKWIKAECEKRNKKIADKAIIELIKSFDYLNKNANQSLFDISNEIEKLTALIGNKTEITEEIVRKCSIYSFQNDVFLLIDSLSKRKADETQIRFQKLLADGEPAMKIIAFLRNQFKIMLRVKEMDQQGYPASKIATKLKQHPFSIQNSLKHSANFEEKKLIVLLNSFNQLDRHLKSGKMDATANIELLMAEICV
ncbi:DNA polymerase III subunit delta [Tindallia californiensis]|uniref:DNA polymerase III subunit delta n=1 Tax=Tindallia californiensis TaxID=159292 RepID=A0A1H3IUF0_9FIRM|nr:DNA polymerase III subunit delta [Tindallia californiensis]SDY31366.1 DNA polymerase III, delta subunit [Tindallia californiensis]